MGCDEPIGALVVNALLNGRYQDWLGVQMTAEGGSPAKPAEPTAPPTRKRQPPSKAAKKPATSRRAPKDLAVAKKGPSSRRAAINDAAVQAVDQRLRDWLANNQHEQAGNLGEQVALRVLQSQRYEVMATQALMKGGIRDIVGEPTRMNAEDFVVVTPDGRLATVNSKAVYSERSSKVLADGNLRSPSIGQAQRAMTYARERANLLSPIEGNPYSIVIEVDLVAKLAQFFEIADDLTMVRVGEPISVLDDIVTVCARHRDDMPAPFASDDAALDDEQP